MALNFSLYEALCQGRANFVKLLIEWGATPANVSFEMIFLDIF